ncbi:MAG: hypothetical protein CMB76_05470 [Euryarchaeota archaeon]|nr:hypothetical protein [Euryarchaeota archaeon]|tara:strand:+ start:6330 stop:7580 length:1251 start_codon:yes stop_codon:yes gene_type:complete
MQECRVCGLLFLGGGACPTCGSQVAVDIETDDIVMDDDSIPGLDEIADAIGEADEDSNTTGENLPFGMGAKAEVIESSLPFGVGSFSDSVTEVAIPIGEQDYDDENDSEIDLDNVEQETAIPEKQVSETAAEIEEPTQVEGTVSEPENIPSDLVEESINISESMQSTNTVVEHVASEQTVVEEVPDLWRIDAAAVDMDAIYAQDEQIVEVSFEEEMEDSDVQVTFDDFHYSPEEDSMASDDDAPVLHPARALPVDSSGQPEIAKMIDVAFDHMGNSAWMQAAQILSTASTNRQNDPSILNNLGLALLQSALEMDAQKDPMSSSQYEASIMALRQAAKIDSNNNTILLNLSHVLLVSGRAEKALGVINVLRAREQNNVEVENVFGACLIQLGRDDEAQRILRPYASDGVVSGNLALI